MTHTDLIARMKARTFLDLGESWTKVLRDHHEAADALTAAQDREKVLEEALRGMLEPFEEDPCRFDHHGYCQEHFLQTAEECCVAVARAALDATGKGEG